jgi:hypothetical protein
MEITTAEGLMTATSGLQGTRSHDEPNKTHK